MNHAELVARAGRWLRSKKHVVVLHEIGSDGRECPDVIGWKYGGGCTLIECKATRGDFLKDKKKRFRREGGMGTYRWYATPKGLVTLDELPTRWGLIEIGAKLVRVVRHPIPFAPLERNITGETACLISAVQRVTEGWGRKVFGEISPVHGQADPHPSALKSLQRQHKNLAEYNARIQAENAKLRARLNEYGDFLP